MKQFVNTISLAATMVGVFFAHSAYAANAVTMAEFEHCMVTASQDVEQEYPGHTFTFDYDILASLSDDCAPVWHAYMEGASSNTVAQEVSDRLKLAREKGFIPDLRAQQYGFRVIAVGNRDANAALSSALSTGENFKTVPVVND